MKKLKKSTKNYILQKNGDLKSMTMENPFSISTIEFFLRTLFVPNYMFLLYIFKQKLLLKTHYYVVVLFNTINILIVI